MGNADSALVKAHKDLEREKAAREKQVKEDSDQLLRLFKKNAKQQRDLAQQGEPSVVERAVAATQGYKPL